MISFRNSLLIYVLGGLFILLNAFVLLEYNELLAGLVPVILAVVLMLFFATDKLLLLMFFCAPLSLNLENLGAFGVGMYLPTEPVLLALTVIVILSELIRPTFPRKLLLHPISIGIYMYLIWLVITAVTSTHSVVSFKFVLSRIWFIVPVYFFGARLLNNRENIRNMMWLYLLPLVGVVIYTLIRHAVNNFEEDPAHWVMTPFFKDHTSYGAMIAMFIPVSIGFLYETDIQFWKKWMLRIFTVVMIVGLIFSYTRAAWVSLLAAIGVLIILKFRISWKYVAVLLVALSAFALVQREKILMDAERNRIDSSDDFADHMTSATNISTDASNLERINRWNSAIEMWKKKPVFGWGPGVYAFEYAPFQHPDDLTIISTHFGDMGNAHSEYLGALSETGLPGALLFTGMVLSFFVVGVRLYFRLKDPADKRLVLVMILGLTTYFLHSALNNYLDTDKAAIPVWGFIAAIVAMDIRNKQQIKDRLSSNEL